MSITKPFTITKELIMQAYHVVKANKGSHGIDKQSLEAFHDNWQKNLYKLWNRMSSGSYFPNPVRKVCIPKKTGGQRILGVPTIIDRIASTAIKLSLEPILEKHFHINSYGYRPQRSALDAIAITRERCRYYDWMIEFDIEAMFDNLSWELILKAVKHHTDCPWTVLYVERCIKVTLDQGESKEEGKGIIQGSPLSPLLANLVMHYAFDLWMQRNYPTNPFCRYSDDGLIHCRTEEQAQEILQQMQQRLEACGLRIHESKTRIVYCKDGKRRQKYKNYQLDFLGYTFRPRLVLNSKNKSLFISFSPAVSKASLKSMRRDIRNSNIRNRTELSLIQIAKVWNPILRGWIQYYGKHHKEALEPLGRHFNLTLIAWSRRKYKKLKNHKTQAGLFIERIKQETPKLFEHWHKGIGGGFV